MTTLEFSISCVPPKTTAQTKRVFNINGKPRFVPTKEHMAEERTLEALLAPHQPAEPVVGAVSLCIELTWPWRKSDLSTHAKRIAAQAGSIWNSSKPDCDNVAKAFIDILSKMRFIEDDARVVDLRIRKFFGSNPGIKVTIKRFEMRCI